MGPPFVKCCIVLGKKVSEHSLKLLYPYFPINQVFKSSLFIELLNPYLSPSSPLKKGKQKSDLFDHFLFRSSLFNPELTDNQQTFFDYAREAGWQFVAQLNQLHIFCSDADAIFFA